MAQIKQIGPGRKTTGTIDGITYVVRNGKTFVRSNPIMPAKAYTTPAALKRQAIFKMIQMHLKYHLRTIKQTFTPKGNGNATNSYYAVNGKALRAALDTLADVMVAGEIVTIDDVEEAICAYAAANPKTITIGRLAGYGEVYLEGEWPATITLRAAAGASTIVVIVAENGTTTTFNPDGSTVVVESGSSGSSSSSGSSQNQNENQNQNGGNNGSSSSSGSSGSSQNQNENQNQNGGNNGSSGSSSSSGSNSGTPVLTISKSGNGTATVSVGGSEVSSGAELAENTEVSLSVTPATGQTPTATLNGNTVTLTEDSGTYTGSFQMPSSNATLVINTGTSGDNGDTN